MQDYKVIKELGSGSFGRVYKVQAKADGKIMAMKQIKMKELNARDKDNALNEVRLLASIHAPNVIKYYSAFYVEQGNLLCIVMEFANGGDLEGILKKKVKENSRFKEDLIWKVAYDLLKGMKILHNNKIIHRDIKSANVFIVDGVAKLGDLNVSKVMEGKFATTQTGTPYYIAPEIWTGKKYDSKCDIWSFGCLLYELCCLRPPFMAKDFPGLTKKVLSGYYDPISSTFSKKLSQLIRRCLTVDQTRRPCAIELLMDDVFNDMESGKGGEVDMLDTIRCPRFLTNLNKQLPEKRFSKKLVTMKVIEDEPTSGFSDLKQRQLKKVRSQKNIPTYSVEKENNKLPPKLEFQGIIDKLRNPMSSPAGHVKLPKIGSQKRL